MRLSLLLALLSSCRARAAYVQSHPCPEVAQQDDTIVLDGLRATILPAGHDFTHLNLDVYTRDIHWTSCEDVALDEYAASIEIASLGKTRQYQSRLANHTCETRSSHGTDAKLRFGFDVTRPKLLDSWSVTLKLKETDGTSVACLKAPVTPYIGKTVSLLAMWFPIFIVGLVVFLAIWNVCLDNSLGQPGRGLVSTDKRGVMMRVSDCISYIQFIFFSGALGLSYPGFFQPLVSHTSWATLMLPKGLVSQDPWFQGVQDGIHVSNGTLGGTPGLNLMIQAVGGTVSMYSWLNTAVLAILTVVALAAVVAISQRLRRAQSPSPFMDKTCNAQPPRPQLKFTLWVVARLSGGYLLLPMTAWSTFQLCTFPLNRLDQNLTAITAILVLAMVTCWGLARRDINVVSPLSLAYNPHQTPSDNNRWTSDLYTALSLVLVLVRGTVIGTLQSRGSVQLGLLIAAEVLQISLHRLREDTTSMWTTSNILCAVKTAILAMQVAFLPHVAGFDTKIILGYLIVGTHTFVLFGASLLPSIWSIYRLLSNRQLSVSEDQPQIYSLQQIMRRVTLPDNQWNTSDKSDLEPLPNSSQGFSDHSIFSSEAGTRSHSCVIPLIFSETSRFTRASSYSRPILATTPQISILRHDDEEQEQGETDTLQTVPLPSHPDVDYTFREADLYYGPPRKLSFGAKAG